MQFLRFIGNFVAIVLFLTVTIKERTIFSYIYSAISPVTIPTQRLTEDLVSSSFNAAHTYTKKLFENSVPNVRKDSIKLRQSSIAKPAIQIAEEIDDMDRDQLDELIKSH